MANSKTNKQSTPTGSHLGFEATLWAAADKLRGNLDAFAKRHADLENADYILANPPWGGDRLREDARWKFGVPPAGKATAAEEKHVVLVEKAGCLHNG